MDLEGTYLDGQTARRYLARVRLTPLELHILVEGREARCWPWKEVRQPRNFYGEGQIRLERGGNTPEVLVVPAPSFFQRLEEAAPGRRKYFRKPRRKKKWAAIALLSALGVAGMAAVLYLWGIPALATRAAAHFPPSWEERLGQAAVEPMVPPEKRCADTNRARKIEEILETLTHSLPGCPYTFRIIVANHSAVNAFAVPGGTIVVFRGLLEKTRRAEELAGVLAHEIQHVLHRHATRAMLQQASIKLLLAGLMGDSRAMTYSLEGVQAVGMMRYSRQYEDEADEEGMKLILASGIDPQGMISFFETMHAESEKSLRLPAYLSSHPDLEDRIRRLKQLAGKSRPDPARLLPGYNWEDIHGFCGSAAPPH